MKWFARIGWLLLALLVIYVIGWMLVIGVHGVTFDPW